MSQDAVVTDYTALATTDAQTITNDLLTYNRALSNILFDVAALGADHKAQIAAIPLTDLLQLRSRLEILTNVVRLTISGSYL